MTLVKRHVTVRFQLEPGKTFNSNGSDTIEVSGLRCSASINKEGGVSMARLDLRVFGLELDVMNKLTILGKPLVDGRHNVVTVLAGDDDAGMAVVFQGVIQEAWVDARAAPSVAFIVSAFTGIIEALKPVQPVTYKGTVDAALVVSGIAQQNGYAFENSGVSVQISNPYLAGTMLDQLQKIARAGNFNCVLDSGTPSGPSSNDDQPKTITPTIAIWPAGKERHGAIPKLAPPELVGYPMRTENGLSLQTLFNPSIVFGGAVQVESSIVPANGKWTVFRVSHDLESETVGGKWFTTLECSIFGQETAIG